MSAWSSFDATIDILQGVPEWWEGCFSSSRPNCNIKLSFFKLRLFYDAHHLSAVFCLNHFCTCLMHRIHFEPSFCPALLWPFNTIGFVIGFLWQGRFDQFFHKSCSVKVQKFGRKRSEIQDLSNDESSVYRVVESHGSLRLVKGQVWGWYNLWWNTR